LEIASPAAFCFSAKTARLSRVILPDLCLSRSWRSSKLQSAH
jgi:hypothetical protein